MAVSICSWYWSRLWRDRPVWIVTITSMPEALIHPHSILIADKSNITITLGCHCTYIKGALVAYTVQNITKAQIAVAHFSWIRSFLNTDTLYRLSNHTQNHTWVNCKKRIWLCSEISGRWFEEAPVPVIDTEVMVAELSESLAALCLTIDGE